MTRVVTRTTRLFVLIDDLQLQALTHKYVDDTTISEVVTKDESSQMQSVVDELVNWSGADCMNINGKKTNEMVLDPLLRRQFLSPLMIADQTVELVTVLRYFKTVPRGIVPTSPRCRITVTATSSIRHPTAPGRTASPAQLLWPTGFLCGWSVGLEFPAGQLAESDYWREQFQTISEDVSVRNVLMHSAH